MSHGELQEGGFGEVEIDPASLATFGIENEALGFARGVKTEVQLDVVVARSLEPGAESVHEPADQAHGGQGETDATRFSGIDRADADAIGNRHSDQGVVGGDGAIDAFHIGLPGQRGDLTKSDLVKVRPLAGDFTNNQAVGPLCYPDVAVVAQVDGGGAAHKPGPKRFVPD